MNTPVVHTLALFNLGAPELIVIGIVGILLFGRRLPEVGKSLGRTIVEFKKGLSAASDELAKSAETEDEVKVLKVKPQTPLKESPQVKRIASSSDEP